MIRRSSEVTILYILLVRPDLEYYIQMWSPQYWKDMALVGGALSICWFCAELSREKACGFSPHLLLQRKLILEPYKLVLSLLIV